MFNLKWSTTDTRKNRLVGFIHNIYPKRDTTLTSCLDSRQIPRTASFRQGSMVIIKDSINNIKINQTYVTVAVKYIDYNKILNGNFGINNIKPYLINIETQELITNDPPQSLSQESINGEWKTLIVRDLREIPKIIVKLDSCNQDICAVRLMNQQSITDNLKVVTYDYVHYETLSYIFYRFNLGNTYYLAPVTDLKDPITNRIIVNSEIAIKESLMITRLKTITKAYERNYLANYKPNVDYTR